MKPKLTAMIEAIQINHYREKMLVNAKQDFENKKEIITKLVTDMSFKLQAGLICFHICLNPHAENLEKIVVLIAIITFSEILSAEILSRKLFKLNVSFNKLQRTVNDKIPDLNLAEELPCNQLLEINSEISALIDKKASHTFLSKSKFRNIIFVIVLSASLLLFPSLSSEYYILIVILLFSLCISETIVQLRNIILL